MGNLPLYDNFWNDDSPPPSESASAIDGTPEILYHVKRDRANRFGTTKRYSGRGECSFLSSSFHFFVPLTTTLNQNFLHAFRNE